MAKNKKIYQPTEEMKDLMKKSLVLELFKMNVAQADIGKKLRMELATVNNFLKGIKKNVRQSKNGRR